VDLAQRAQKQFKNGRKIAMTRKKVAVIGSAGKMGQEVCKYLLNHNDYELAACIDIAGTGEDICNIINCSGAANITISNDLSKSLKQNHIDLAIEFSTPSTVVENAAICLQHKVPVLIGATGITKAGKQELQQLAEENDCSVLIVSNFAIGAILMMEFARKAARYMQSAEIIEMHHQHKLDKPSGTARATRRKMLKEKGLPESSDEIPVHSVRLPGLVAHQMVVLGDNGQTLTIRHDSLNRESFMPGVGLGLEQLQKFKGLQTGLKLD
jgi:4-hydroxy-tetrahydrodipicolinate reductase